MTTYVPKNLWEPYQDVDVQRFSLVTSSAGATLQVAQALVILRRS